MVEAQPDDLPDEIARMLFEAWIVHLSSQRLGLSQHSGALYSGSTLTVGRATADHFTITVSDADVSLDSVEGVDRTAVESIIDKAVTRVGARDFGGIVIYRVDMTVPELDFVSGSMHFMRTLGDQVRIDGSRRLSNVVLLDFREEIEGEQPEAGLLLAPRTRIEALIYVPGPSSSDLTRRTVAGIAEIVAAVCALALGRPVDYHPPMFPAKDEDRSDAMVRRDDRSILGLARNSVSLDVLHQLQQLGGPDAVLRARGALLAYHAALRQSSADVAVMLLVSCMEALISPRQEWRKRRVTRRFIESTIELCAEAVDSVVNHGNVEQAFDFRLRGGVAQRRRDLLDAVYKARSLPTHAGLGLSPTGFFELGSSESMRVALLSDLARAAILNFVQRPRSSIIGHPEVDPVVDA